VRFECFWSGPFGTIHVGTWKGGAYTNDSTGAFAHCAAGSDYVSGVGLIVGRSADHSWLLGFISASWNLTLGATIPIDIIFDGKAQFRVFGNVPNSKLISAPLPDAAANRMRKSHLMVATANNQTFQFNLGSVEKLMPMITNCVDKVRTGGVANAGDFSIPAPKPPIVPTAAKSNDSEEPTPAEKPEKLVNVNATGFVISTRGHVLANSLGCGTDN
jgi:hypothetical protein